MKKLILCTAFGLIVNSNLYNILKRRLMMSIDEIAFFDKYPEKYENGRMFYNPQIFEDIIEKCSLKADNKLFEIGCGTGKATEFFINKGFFVESVEVGANLCEYVKNKFENKLFRVFNDSFENYQTNNKYDMIYAATSFHWIDPQTAYCKAKKLLNDNGFLVTFWNRILTKDEYILNHINHDYINSDIIRIIKNKIDEIKKVPYFDLLFYKIYSMDIEIDYIQYINYLETHPVYLELDRTEKKKIINMLEQNYKEKLIDVRIVSDLYIQKVSK